MSKELNELNEKLEKALANGTAKFTFRKKDGSIRTAFGTNKPSIVPNFYTFKGSTAAVCISVTRYYDLEKAAFRSFRKDTLISVEIIAA